MNIKQIFNFIIPKLYKIFSFFLFHFIVYLSNHATNNQNPLHQKQLKFNWNKKTLVFL